jgi:uncharacterized protein with FMN-binding domain
MMKKFLKYTATTSAAAIFTAVGTAGLAMADHDDDEYEDEEDDDDYSYTNPICETPESIEAAIQSELANSPALNLAKSKVSKAKNALKKAVAVENKAFAASAKKPVKKAANSTARSQAKALRATYVTAHENSVKATKALKDARINAEKVRVNVETAIRSRYSNLCGVVEPTPTETMPTNPVVPTPVDTTGPSISPTPTPTDTVTPTPTDTATPTPTPTDPTPPPPPPVVNLSAPTNVAAGTATSLNTGAMRITWSAVTGATSYKILRDGVQIGTSSTTSFTPSVTAGSKSSYTVIATDGSNDSSASTAVSAGKYEGTVVADKRGLTNYGNIQVFIVVTGTQLTGCWATYPTNSDSGSINRNAIPKLCAEAITKQSSALSAISGASATVPAFKTSLQAALTAAGI